MSTEEAQTVLAQGIENMVDTTGLQEQLADSMESYMGELMGSFSGTLADTLQ
ncbi:MAG TPA: hypothetical protein IAC99_03260, partial [Candidatus Choladocola avistercoris]|nr:hypothetical protein [Candidatus Choladocola avistercoris]